MATLITGGTGFIGAEVARVLVGRGETDVAVFDINPSKQRLDAALATVALADAPADAIQMVNYLLAGVTPIPSAKDLAEMVQRKIPDARISFEVNEELQPILDKLLKPIDDRYAREEWAWRAAYDLEDMIDDFLSDLREKPQRYQ